ncbi:VWA domain-containing protein [Mycolicibacterium brisbanense]
MARGILRFTAHARSTRLLVAAVLAAAVVVMGWAPVASAETASGGAKRFGACLAAQKTGDLLLLFDESGSLQQTDPDGARVDAARYLLQTLGRYADRVDAKLDVAAAGFSDTYKPEHDWSELTAATADATAQQLNEIKSKNNGLDTDYWQALDGARQALAARGQGPNGGQRCQAIAWFSDGQIDFTPRQVTKPYAEGVDLSTQAGVDQAKQKSIDSICRSGGLADQIRSAEIVTLAVGLGAKETPADFDVMSAIATGKGLNGMKCGNITDPVPGDFYPVSNIDDMLFAFDSLTPDPGINTQGPVCQLQVCPEARHNFVLDKSIKSVNILGSGDVTGVVPYLVSPSGQTVELPKKDGKVNVEVGGTPVSYEWQSETAQSIAINNAGSGEWAGQWAIVYVDTTGEHADAVSKVNIHISTDIFPALLNADKVQWRSGATVDNLTFGLVDAKGKPVPTDSLAGTAEMTVQLVPDGKEPISLLDAAAKEDIGKPVKADLSKINPGRATLKMSLVVTTAPAVDPAGVQIAPGTKLSPQDKTETVQILPKLGLPTPGERIDFGTVQAAKGVTAQLAITGPGCAWIADGEAVKTTASPDDIGTATVTSPSNSSSNCLKVSDGQTGQLQVTLRTEHDGHGGLNGTVPVHVAALDHPDDGQVVDVPFVASLIKPLNTTNFVLVLIAALLLGPGIPLGLLYLSKWWVTKIPNTPLLAERIPVEVNQDMTLRNGEPFAMAEADLVQPVTGLTDGVRRLSVLGVTLNAVMGRSPFGAGRVVVDAGNLLSVSSELPGTDGTGLHAVLPLAVHNTWVVLHDPRGPASQAEVLLLVSGNTDTAAREKIFEEVARRLPELLGGLRLRAVQAGQASPYDDQGQGGSPFGEGAGGGAPTGYDPFGGGGGPAPVAPVGSHAGAPQGADPFASSNPSFGGSAAAPAPSAPRPDPHEVTQHAPVDYRPGANPPPPDPYEVTQQAPITYQPGGYPQQQPPQQQPPQHQQPPPDDRRGGQPPAPPQRYDSDPFDPFGGGA